MTNASLDLASLLCSRLCHDLLSPVGALNNGLELLADETDPDMRRRCFELLEQSAKISADKLKFFRLAFGAAGGFGELVPVAEARVLVDALVGNKDRVAVNWALASDSLPKPGVKTLLNFALIGLEALVRGGALDIGAELRDGTTEIVVRAAGPKIAFDRDIGKALQGLLEDGELSSRTAPAAMLYQLASTLGGGLQYSLGDDALVLGAVLPGGRSTLVNRWLVHREQPSPNFDERVLPVSMVVLHYTGMQSAADALERLCDPRAKVSAHYLIDEAGTVTALVPEEKRAWHAGRSYWRGIADVNSASVGIELANPGHEWGYRPFPDAQMEALLPLLADIVDRHDIAPANVVGHSDIAPARKEDPGELFDWERLARLRLALPIPKPKMWLVYDNPGAFYLALERFGYDITDGRAAVRAFQRRWRPKLIDGEIDGQIGGLLFELLLERDLLDRDGERAS